MLVTLLATVFLVTCITMVGLHTKCEEWTLWPHKKFYPSPVMKKPRKQTLLTMTFLLLSIMTKSLLIALVQLLILNSIPDLSTKVFPTLNLLSVAFLNLALLFELREWLRLAVEYSASVELIGDRRYFEILKKNLDYHSLSGWMTALCAFTLILI